MIFWDESLEETWERFADWFSFGEYGNWRDDSERDYDAEWESTPLHQFLSGKMFKRIFKKK